MPRQPRANRELKQRRRDDVRAFLLTLNIAPGLTTTQERREVLAKFFGGKCKRCGFDDMRALQIDHVNSDGYRSMTEWRWLLWDIVRSPERFQCLCANCNWIKRHENGEHPGAKTKARPAPRRDWIDEWIRTEGLRPYNKKAERARARRLKMKEIEDRAKELRRADREARRLARLQRLQPPPQEATTGSPVA